MTKLYDLGYSPLQWLHTVASKCGNNHILVFKYYFFILFYVPNEIIVCGRDKVN